VVIFDTPLTDAEKLPLDHTDENTSRPVGGIASFFYVLSVCLVEIEKYCFRHNKLLSKKKKNKQ